MSEKIRVRWAFDPFADHVATWESAYSVLRQIKNSQNCEIVPTYVIGSDATQWIAYALPKQDRDVVEGIQKAMAGTLEQVDKDRILSEPDILHSPAVSKRADATAMAEQMDDFNLLVINTHAYKGLERFFLGSFAEDTLLRCKKPILFVSPKTKIEKMERVLFPTDFTEKSEAVFKALVKNNYGLAKHFQLYSKVAHPATALVSNTSMLFGGGAITLDQYLGDVSAEKVKHAQKWKEFAEENGATADFRIDNSPGILTDGILAEAKDKGADFIAMPSFASKLETLFVGSTARRLLRETEIPTLVWPCRQRERGSHSLLRKRLSLVARTTEVMSSMRLLMQRARS